MKFSIFASLSLAALAVASPDAPAPVMKRQTSAQLKEFGLFAQWSSASACNNAKPAGALVTCNLNQCATVQAHGAKVVASFIGTHLDSRGFVGVDPVDKLIVVAFRGSQSIRNWIANFLFLQVPCPLVANCLVHTGFYTSWKELSARVLAGVKTAKTANPSYRIVVTGYSLGGAIATMAAAHIRAAGYAADLVTYGSPRVGNKAFAAYVTAQGGVEYRLTRKDDPVPRLPPIIFNYRHTSPEYWFNEGSDGVVQLSEIKTCSGYASIGCNAGTFGLNVDSHLWYFQKLSGCAPDVLPWSVIEERGEEEVVEGIPASNITDTELEAQLNTWLREDAILATSLQE